MGQESELLAFLQKTGQQSVPKQEEPNVAPPQRPSPVVRKTLFVHHDTHPVVYDVALLKEYGAEWFAWEAVTLWGEILRDFKVPSVSDAAKTKIQAVKTLHISESFWTEWEVFGWLSQALNNNIPDWQTIQRPSIGQMLNAVDIATMVRTGEEFSPEVAGYVAGCFLDEGVLYAPEELKFCQPLIDGFAGAKGVEDYQGIVRAVQDKFAQVRGGAVVELHENVVDVQVAKLKVAWDYLSKRRGQLKEQLLLLS